MKVLILGGTTEAALLATRLVELGHDVITSLAGRTASPATPPGGVRVGGFGGAEGLERYLRDHAIARLIDATHPFAARISGHAARACAAAGVPRLMLVRPMWARHTDDRWVEVPTTADAVALLPRLGQRAFLTAGIGEIAAFADAPVHCVVRLIAAQDLPLADYTVVTGKGPFDAEAERDLMRAHRIDVLVTKASGGAATEGKIVAARELGLPVLMIARPGLPEGERADSVDAAVAWLNSPAAGCGCGPGRTGGNR